MSRLKEVIFQLSKKIEKILKKYKIESPTRFSYENYFERLR
jgi:hypothetical protein